MAKRTAQLVSAVALSLSAGAIGSLATIQNIPNWYAELDKPPLLPPNEVFGPVWGVLYVLVGIALFLVIRAASEDKIMAYILWSAQLVINTLWSIIFFGFQQPIAAVAVIVMLLISVVWVMRELSKISKAAYYLFIPYLLWIMFATYLNIGVAILN